MITSVLDLQNRPEIAARVSRRQDLDDWLAGSPLVEAINGGYEPLSPFGGFKQSGIGREYGTYGLEGFLEPRSVMA